MDSNGKNKQRHVTGDEVLSILANIPGKLGDL
jgi:hypothetical protein